MRHFANLLTKNNMCITAHLSHIENYSIHISYFEKCYKAQKSRSINIFPKFEVTEAVSNIGIKLKNYLATFCQIKSKLFLGNKKPLKMLEN